MPGFARRLGLLLLLVLFGLGCGTRVVREPVFQQGQIESYLRRYKQSGEIVARGFDHPAIIAPVRLAHILSFVDVEVGSGKDRERVPAVPPVVIYAVADALGAALEAAGPDDEVVVRAVRKERRFGIFHRRFLTSFLAYVRDELLTLTFGHVDWEIPKMGATSGDDELPEPKEGEQQMQFRILPDDALVLLGPQTLAVDWRNDRFREPERIRLAPTGKVKRRTILLGGPSEPEEEAAPEAADPPLPPAGLAPETLRRLADLEELRQSGEITEAEYQARRRALLAADPAAR